MFYQKASAAVAHKLYSSNYIKNEEQEIYAYCMEIILSTIVDLLTVFILSCCFHRILPTLIFLAGFFAARALCGGHHANHHITCYLTFIANYGLFLFFDYFILILKKPFVCNIVLLFLSCIIIFVFSPIDHPNNPMTTEQLRRSRKRNQIIIVVFACLFTGLLMLWPNAFCISPFLFGIFSAACSLLVAAIKKKKEVTNYEE